MTKVVNIPMVAKSLTPTQGKVLRYTCSVGVAVHPSMCVNQIEWSEMPHSLLQATRTYHVLLAKGLVKRDGIDFGHTKAGTSVIAYANKKDMWRTNPPPEAAITRPKRRNR